MSATAVVLDVSMPRLSDSMEEGTVVSWLVADGSPVALGEAMVEIETDKAIMSFEAEIAGVLHVVAAEGDTLAVGETIARIVPKGVKSPADSSSRSPTVAATWPPGPPIPRLTGAEPTPATPRRVNASPVARRAAKEHHIDLVSILGSGPGGRIVKADVLASTPGTDAQPTSATATGDSPTDIPSPGPSRPEAGSDVTIVELSRVQQVVAARMTQSKSAAPDFVVEVEVDMAAAVALRAQLKTALANDGGGPPPSLNDMVVAACGRALREHPRANGSYQHGHFELHDRVDVGVAVAGDDSLFVPTVRDADTRSLGAIATEVRRLAALARDNALTPPDLSGGTFSVSNLGMFGVDRFAAVLNPPQAGILAVGAVRDRVVARDGEQTVCPTMYATLTCDHRILYGADAARFLSRIRSLLETPELLLL